MPKTPKNKKKRAKVDLERRKKKAKRLKFDDEVEGQQIQHEGSGSEHNEEDDDSDSTEGGENMLEKMLEEHAVKNNLSAINVKSILHVSVCLFRFCCRCCCLFVCFKLPCEQSLLLPFLPVKKRNEDCRNGLSIHLSMHHSC